MIIERIQDFLRERRIAKYRTAMERAWGTDRQLAWIYGDLMKAEIQRRSPQQIARMESRLMGRVI